MVLEIIILSEVSQTGKDQYYIWVGQKVRLDFSYDVTENPNEPFGQPNIVGLNVESKK